MSLHHDAGKLAPKSKLVDLTSLVAAYHETNVDLHDPDHAVAFGTSGHRGSSLLNTFNEFHILAIMQAICEYRKSKGITGPLYLGMDTHALSRPAHTTAIEVGAANGVSLFIDEKESFTPTPVISHAIVSYNRGRKDGFADGVVITPSHNPPEDGGFKYNPPAGGPADTSTTTIIQNRANEILRNDLKDVKRMPYERALSSDTVRRYDFITPYVKDLENVIDMRAIAASGLKIGADPMGGAGLEYWDPVKEHFDLDLEVVNRDVDARFAFMPVDKDGKIRMDCSSAWAMAHLIKLKDKFDIAFGNDPDFDRHGIVTGSHGLMNPNHYLAVAVSYLFQNRPQWRADAAIGKTLVSSSMIDRVAAAMNRQLCEVPVGFKYFVDGLLSGNFGFGGEESAGASFLRMDGSVWCTDKDGFIMDLLAAEICAKTGKNPAEHYEKLTEEFGTPIYSRSDAPATKSQKEILKNLSVEQVTASTMAGDEIVAKLTHAPGNKEAIGGLKVVTNSGWFAARPSGTEDIYKIYAESFKGESHLTEMQEEARAIVTNALTAS